MSKIDETVKLLQEHIEELNSYAKEKGLELNDSAQKKIEAIKTKTTEVFNLTIDKIKNVVEDSQAPEKVDEFVEKVKTKSTEALEYTKTKIDEVASKTPKQSLEKISDDIEGGLDKIIQSDFVKQIGDFFKEVGDSIVYYFNRPEVQDAINKAKVGTINASKKVTEGLEKLLKPEDAKEEGKEITSEEIQEDINKAKVDVLDANKKANEGLEKLLKSEENKEENK